MTSTDLAKTKAFGSLKLADWPETDRALMQEARKAEDLPAGRRRGLGMARRRPSKPLSTATAFSCGG